MSSPRLSVLTSVYKGEAYLAAYCAEIERQSLFPEVEVVFVCNDPSAREREVVDTFRTRHPDQVQVIEVPRETLGASWNRAWVAARAPLLSIWNIDDRRVPDSLERQVETMCSSSDVALCYGDYVLVKEYGSEKGVLRKTPQYDPDHFARAYAQGGSFWVFRRELGDKTGYFDEQFKVAVDMDYSFRIAFAGLPMQREKELLGFFTDAGEGLSTRDQQRQSILERTVVQLRFGVFDKVRPDLKAAASQFQLREVLSFGEWHALPDYLPSYDNTLRAKVYLWAFGYLRFGIRNLLESLGILPWFHRTLARLSRKEL